MKKLSLDLIHVESFATTQPETCKPGTVHGRQNDPSAIYGTCDIRQCGTESRNQPTCEYSCGNNYGCDSIDPRCTYGGVYPC